MLAILVQESFANPVCQCSLPEAPRPCRKDGTVPGEFSPKSSLGTTWAKLPGALEHQRCPGGNGRAFTCCLKQHWMWAAQKDVPLAKSAFLSANPEGANKHASECSLGLGPDRYMSMSAPAIHVTPNGCMAFHCSDYPN